MRVLGITLRSSEKESILIIPSHFSSSKVLVFKIRRISHNHKIFLKCPCIKIRCITSMIFFLVIFLIDKSHFQILEEFRLFTICLLLNICRLHDPKYITWVNTGMGKALSTLWNMSSVVVCNILPGSKWKINSLFQKHIHQSQEAIVFSLWVYISLNLSSLSSGGYLLLGHLQLSEFVLLSVLNPIYM